MHHNLERTTLGSEINFHFEKCPRVGFPAGVPCGKARGGKHAMDQSERPAEGIRQMMWRKNTDLRWDTKRATRYAHLVSADEIFESSDFLRIIIRRTA